MQNNLISIIPYPCNVELLAGRFEFSDQPINIFCPSTTIPLLNNFHFQLKKYGFAVQSGQKGNSKNGIYIRHQQEKKESYTIEIQKKNILITTGTDRMLFYALQTILQLIISARSGKLILPCMKIIDKPRFLWRGMHLDVSRHFMPKEFIKKYLDILALLKMNYFHWHLCDDQGWRIEIKKYPELTGTGAWRDRTLIGHHNRRPHFYKKQLYGGFYTQNDIREIVDYASKRYITIVPEIEMPGHCQAAVAAYPDLGCTKKKATVRSSWGISPYVYNISQYTINFLCDVLDEVTDLFPGQYIHLGGDEVKTKQWERSPETKKRMKEISIKNYSQIPAYFIKQIHSYLQKRNKTVIVWDDLLDNPLPPDLVIMAWQETARATRAVRKGHNVIMTPVSHCYLDHYKSKNKHEPLAIGGHLPLHKVYNFDPVPLGLNSTEQSKILGPQGNVWTEYMPTHRHVEYMLFPRIFAMAEVQWSPKNKKDYTSFLQRLQAVEKYLEQTGIHYTRHDPNKI